MVILRVDYVDLSDNNCRVLELCLKDVLSLIKPMENDRVKRLNIINEFSSLVRSVESLKGAVITPFGSFVSNLYTKWGDLDISVEVSHNLHVSTARNRKQIFLRDIMRALSKAGGTHDFKYIPTARVPLLKFKIDNQNIACDISIDNHLAHIKSKILLWVSHIDERFRDMVLLVKEWAKAKNINDPKSGTLNSFSLCLLVIFHFQTCVPAILPPLKEIYGGSIGDDVTGATERHIEDICAANIARFRSQRSRQRNQSSLSQLLFKFFEKFSGINKDAREYAISTYTGAWERSTQKSQCLLIKDPFEHGENVARAVRFSELDVISNAFMGSYRDLLRHDAHRDRRAMLASLARPSVISQIGNQNQGPARGSEQQQNRTGSGSNNSSPALNVARLRDRVDFPSSSSSVSASQRQRNGESTRVGYIGVIRRVR